jgi:lysophospholipase L1-like esterase
MTPPLRPRFAIWLAGRPWPLLLGIGVGFLACCAAGRLAAQRQPFDRFVRFHLGIAPDSHLYPTFSQTLNLARSRVRPGKTLVVVGGNRILQGVGQRAEFIWTKALQQELGDQYVVVNLAMRGAFPHEFAGLIAERLATDGIPLIFVTIGTVNTGWKCDWDGKTYRWLLWDAWGKGLLPPEERRDWWLAEGFDSKYAHDEAMQERRRRGLIDGVVYADDLWNYTAYRYFGTIWTSSKNLPLWTPHRRTIDPDRGDLVPLQRRFPESTREFEMRVLRAVFGNLTASALERGEGADLVRAEYEAFLPQILRPRSLYVFRLEAKQYRDQLSPDELTRYERIYEQFTAALNEGGLHAVLVGKDYTAGDYFDRSHLSEAGGRRLARDLAPVIRQLNQQLYFSAPGATAGDRP